MDSTILADIRTGMRKMLEHSAKPTEAWMAMSRYSELVGYCYHNMLISPPCDFHMSIILDENGKQLPIGHIYELDIYIDNRLPHEQIIIK